jgi:hypothetical protein
MDSFVDPGAKDGQKSKSNDKGRDKDKSNDKSRSFALLRMTTRKAKTNAGPLAALRSAQDDKLVSSSDVEMGTRKMLCRM